MRGSRVAGKYIEAATTPMSTATSRRSRLNRCLDEHSYASNAYVPSRCPPGLHLAVNRCPHMVKWRIECIFHAAEAPGSEPLEARRGRRSISRPARDESGCCSGATPLPDRSSSPLDEQPSIVKIRRSAEAMGGPSAFAALCLRHFGFHLVVLVQLYLFSCMD
jgi:hypothetical protein